MFLSIKGASIDIDSSKCVLVQIVNALRVERLTSSCKLKVGGRRRVGLISPFAQSIIAISRATPGVAQHLLKIHAGFTAAHRHLTIDLKRKLH